MTAAPAPHCDTDADINGYPPLPSAFLELLEAIVPPSHRAGVDRNYTEAKWVTWRTNPLRADPTDTLAELAAASTMRLQPIPGASGVYLTPPDDRQTLTHLPAAGDGRLYIQGLASMAAVEPVKARFYRLKANLQRLGAGHVHTYLKDGAIVGKLTPQRFDRVLLDAPCSSEAQFTRLDPDSRVH